MKHKQLIYVLTFMMSISTFSNIYGQESDTVKSPDYSRRIRFNPIPVVAANPTLGFVFGVTTGLTWYMGSPENTSLSVAVASMTYTTNNQFLSSLRSNMFLRGDEWNLLTDVRYLDTSQPTYGLGTGDRSARLVERGTEPDIDLNSPFKKISGRQMVEYKFVRLHQTFLKRYENTRFFGGLGYHLDYVYNIDDNLLDLESDPQQITYHHYYNTHKGISTKSYGISGISANGIFDSRDNTANPYRGQYAWVNLRVNPEFLGSTRNSSLVWVEYRNYFNLSKERPRHLIAVWTYGNFLTSGTLPYMTLPGVGRDMNSRSGRAYTVGRFRGEDLLYLESEYRFPLQKNSDKLGGVIFVNAVSASSRMENIHLLETVRLAGGLGLRVMINQASRTNITLDYAWGTNGSQGFFLGLNEAF